MDTYSEIKRRIRELSAAAGGSALFTAEVKSVEGETCTVSLGSVDLPDVLLTPADDGRAAKLVITPKTGSMVTVADLSGGELRRLAVVHWGEVEKVALSAASIEINGGRNGGLVNIGALTQKVNDLVRAFNSHTHTVTTAGTAAAQSGEAAPVASPARLLDTSDYEDTTIKH